ncbi:MAG: YjjG family noncanonical pyrimidine nucleotidase [Prolixibacteraceae bacterium]|nr:YjjG family noncanonical pyrimidine nucleotidase [Prolixibacteraceae bacterium]
MRKYDHLFFDLDNTLWDFTANSYRAMEITLVQNKILPRLNSFESFFEVYEQINKSLWSDYHSRKITKQTLIVERFSKSLQSFNIYNLDWSDLNQQYLRNMALQTELFPGTIETLTTLGTRGYQMHIITNGFSEVQHDKLKNCGLAAFFSKVFISEELHTTKPHRQIFEYALKSTNAKKKKSIMIGDSWETDIEGAINFGIDQIMFLNNGLHELPESIKKLHSTINHSCLEQKHGTRTWFINEISDLNAIL